MPVLSRRLLLPILWTLILSPVLPGTSAQDASESVRQSTRSRRVLYNFDGDSCLSTKAGSKGPVPVNIDDVKRLIEEVAYDGSRVDTVLVCVNAQVMYYPTKVGTMRGTLSTPEERAKWPASEKQRFQNLKAFFDAGVDPYAVMLSEAKRRGCEALLTFRMNDDHGNDFLRTQFLSTKGGGAKNLTADEYRHAATQLIKAGSDGVYLFNFFTSREGGEAAYEPPFEVLCDLAVANVEARKDADPDQSGNARPDGKTVVNVFVLAGQSNMAGADSEVIGPAGFQQTAADRVTQFTTAPLPDGEKSKQYVPWGEIRGHQAKGKLVHGPEVGFARSLYAAGWRDVAIIKVSANFSRDVPSWPWAEKGSLFTAWTKFVDARLAELQAHGHSPRVRGFLWHQGIDDAIHGQLASDYERNLGDLIGVLRKRYANEQTPFVLARSVNSRIAQPTPDPENNSPMALVRRAQMQIGQTVSGAAWINVDDLPNVNTHHFSAASQLVIGQRFGDAFLRLQGIDRFGNEPGLSRQGQVDL